jgi:U3 small nucleolar RNA-associated protein 20
LGVYAIIIESAPESIGEIINVVTPAVNESAQLLQSAETSDDDTIHLEHTVALNALKAIVRALEISPSHSTAENLPWESIVQHLLFPHTGVRLAAARCISILLASTPSANEKEGQGHTGIQILGEETLLDVARKSCLLMKGNETDEGRSEVVDPKLADVLVKILWQISNHWAVSRPSIETGNVGEVSADVQASHTTAVNDDSEDVVEEEDEDEEPAFVKAQNTTKPLAWLMSRMSFLARHLIVHRPSANSNLFTVVGPLPSCLCRSDTLLFW